MADTKRCPNCGVVNDVSNAVCEACLTPLTAYAGQLDGAAYQGKLASQAAATHGRPPAVLALTIFDGLFALGGFWLVAKHFMDRPAVTEEGMNAWQNAGSTFSAIVWAVFLVPLALALIGLAIATWTQSTWTWTSNAVGLGLFAFLGWFAFGFTAVFPKLICVGIAVALGVFWFHPKTKAWFGLT